MPLPCAQLVDEAYQRWLVEEEGVVDDITAVIVRCVLLPGGSGGGWFQAALLDCEGFGPEGPHQCMHGMTSVHSL